MDTGWIQIFVLTLAECVAPPGKSVCQEQQVQYQFVEREECETVLQQLVDYSAGSENVIVDERRSSCLPTTIERQVFASADDANARLGDTEGWGELNARRTPDGEDEEDPGKAETAHRQRLASLPACEDVNREPPCKVGQIIVEEDTQEELEVWKRNQ